MIGDFVRELRAFVDSNRFAGHRVRVRLLEKLDGRRRFEGRVLGVEGDDVLLEQDGEKVSLGFASIESARLVPEF